MTQNKTPSHTKLDECNHIEKTLLLLLNRLGCGITPIMQDLLTGRKCISSPLTEPQEAGA